VAVYNIVGITAEVVPKFRFFLHHPDRGCAKYLLREAEFLLRTDPQLDKKFPTFDGIRRFITAFTSARHLSLS